MAELSVQCSCGRKMITDTLQGAGAYRCGCGARIKISETAGRSPGCSAPDCSTVTADSEMKIPLCRDHRDYLVRYLVPRVYTDWPPEKLLQLGREHLDELGIKRNALPQWVRHHTVPPPPTPDHKVYFIVLGDQVKIGTTQNMKRRLNGYSLPPDAKLALVIPGSYELESELHRRFARDRPSRREWFRLSPEIREYIAERRTAQGLGPWEAT